ncbi:MAG: ECF transporter S component [Coriobacteriales bacterium]|jgi:riboflavin transporter FmnP|nr:ECF transporter S component [Coriobacteriales bacterium]
MSKDNENVDNVAAVSVSPPPPTPPKKANIGRRTRWSARQLATMALLTALSTAFAFFQIPLGLSTLSYDPSNLPGIIGALAYGPIAGTLIIIIGQALHGIFTADFIGAAMNIVLGIAYILPTALICRKNKTTKRLIIGLVIGSLVSFALCIPSNFVAWSVYAGIEPAAVAAMILPFILPFNSIKIVLNSILSFLLYKSLHRFLEPAE